MSRTLFDADRQSLDDALAMTKASLDAYGTSRPWRIAFSGGKDSMAALTAISYLIETGRVSRPASLGVIYADTRLELPNLQLAARSVLEETARRGWRTETVILELIEAKTWPQGWSGTEESGAESAPIHFADGSIQRLLFSLDLLS